MQNATTGSYLSKSNKSWQMFSCKQNIKLQCKENCKVQTFCDPYFISANSFPKRDSISNKSTNSEMDQNLVIIVLARNSNKVSV